MVLNASIEQANDMLALAFSEPVEYKPPFILRVVARDYPLLAPFCYTEPEERTRLLDGVKTHLTVNYGLEIPSWAWNALGGNE